MITQVKGQSFKDCLEWCPNEKNVFHVIEKSSGKQVTTEKIKHLYVYKLLTNKLCSTQSHLKLGPTGKKSLTCTIFKLHKKLS